ncbi:hypothetical protein [Streptomyces sp. NPDC050121]|uniref:hypothetical protein n=1 Tax=Streptomyces sp. NPDC050121 TaxID=3365601 RepID=UPI0037B76F40
MLFSVAFQLTVSLLPGVFTAGWQKYRAVAVLDLSFGRAADGTGFSGRLRPLLAAHSHTSTNRIAGGSTT